MFPLGSRLNERGRLEVGGCDTIELAREFGTPAYVVAEDDLRSRARAFVQAGRDAGHEDFHVVFASKAFPCTAVLELFAQEGLWCDVASGGELHLALNAGFQPERIVLHGNAKSEAELRMALRHRVGLIVVDNFDEIDRLERLMAEGGCSRPRQTSAGAGARDAGRAGRDAREDLHRPGRLEVRLRDGRRRRRRSRACRRVDGLSLQGCTRTSARSCSGWSRFARRWPSWRSSATSRSGTSAAAWACATPPISRPRPRSRSTSARSWRRRTLTASVRTGAC